MDYTKKLNKLKKYLKENLTEKRYKHSLRTAEAAVELAKHHPKLKEKLPKVEFAALAHDIARELPNKKLIKLVKKGEEKITPFERRHPGTIHGKAGVELLKKDWNIKNESVLNAVKFHTMGHPDMDDLAKIVFIADFIEPGRKYHKDWPWLSVQSGSLNDILMGVIEESRLYLRAKRRGVHPQTRKLIKKLKKEIKREQKKKPVNNTN